jgi:5'-nucleotidase
LPGIALSQSLTIPAYERLKLAGGEPEPELRAVLRMSAAHAARIAPALAAETPAQSFIVHNVNFPYPCGADAQVRRTVPARVMIPGLFSPQAEDGTHRLVFNLGEDLSPEGLLTDRAALDAGFISHTVLDFSKLGSI